MRPILLLRKRVGSMLAASIAPGLNEVGVETITETTEFESGKGLWDWIVWSNPIVERVLGSLDLTGDERGVIQRALEQKVRERAKGKRPAALTNPIHIGIGRK